MWRLFLGLVLGFVAGWFTQRYLRQFEADDIAEELIDQDPYGRVEDLIEVGSINATGVSSPAARSASSSSTPAAEVEMAEALSAALSQIEAVDHAEALDLLADPTMSVERDDEGNLVVTMETNPGFDGSAGADSDLDFGELVGEAGPEEEYDEGERDDVE